MLRGKLEMSFSSEDGFLTENFEAVDVRVGFAVFLSSVAPFIPT